MLDVDSADVVRRVQEQINSSQLALRNELVEKLHAWLDTLQAPIPPLDEGATLASLWFRLGWVTAGMGGELDADTEAMAQALDDVELAMANQLAETLPARLRERVVGTTTTEVYASMIVALRDHFESWSGNIDPYAPPDDPLPPTEVGEGAWRPATDLPPESAKIVVQLTDGRQLSGVMGTADDANGGNHPALLYDLDEGKDKALVWHPNQIAKWWYP